MQLDLFDEDEYLRHQYEEARRYFTRHASQIARADTGPAGVPNKESRSLSPHQERDRLEPACHTPSTDQRPDAKYPSIAPSGLPLEC